MSDMARLSGMRVALKKSPSWGEAVQCTQGDICLVRSSGIGKSRQPLPDHVLGGGFAPALDYGPVSVGGPMKAYLRYDGLELPLALAMGQSGGVPVSQAGTSAYAQSLTPVPDNAGLMATLAMTSGVDVHECPSVKFSGITIRGSAGGAVKADFDCIADDLRVDSLVNTVSSISAIDVPPAGPRVMMSHGAFRLNPAADAALGPEDIIHPAGFSLSLVRPMSGAHTAGTQHDTVDEPSLAGPCVCRLKLVFARYRDSSSITAWDMGLVSKMDMTFTGTHIEGAWYRSMRISLPALAPVYAGMAVRDGRLVQEVEYECLATDPAPEGMEGMTAPFVLKLINTRSTDVLA